MEKEQFIGIVEGILLPLFTGSKIVGEEESTARDSEVAQGSGGTVLIKPYKTDEYRLIVKRNQPFKSNEVALIKSIISELIKVAEYNISEPTYLKRLQTTAIEKAICNSLSETASETLLGLINQLGQWVDRTYEGRRTSFGIVLNESQSIQNKMDNLKYPNVLQSDFSALLSDGRLSCLEFDKDGYIMGHLIMERIRFAPTLCPYDFINFARLCNEKRIGIALLESGDMLLFKNRELIFARRRGLWNSYSHEEIIQLLSNRSSHTIKEIRRAIYYTALDVSFSGYGGCIVYLNKDKSEQALSHINAYDILSEKQYELKREMEKEEAGKLYNLDNPDYEEVVNNNFATFIQSSNCVKSATILKIIGNKKFHELNRKLREELVAMDGATIVDYDGTIIATGAIIKIEAGSKAGGRLAATKTLSRYGVSIKISQDGIIQGYTYDKKAFKAKNIFSVG